jgi:propanediol dehydratase small subunit
MMEETPLNAADYPTAETMPDKVRGQRGKTLEALTLDAAVSGDLAMEDLRITPEALLRQAQIARSVGRATLAGNLERAAEMTRLSQDETMQIYELLRPGRANSKSELQDVADRLRSERQAPRLADFIEEAAALYDRRGLFRTRY